MSGEDTRQGEGYSGGYLKILQNGENGAGAAGPKYFISRVSMKFKIRR